MNDGRIIELMDIAKIYRAGKIDVPALQEICLEVESGEFVSIVGPSGCGKSTLLHVIGGLTRPTSGSVRVDGCLLTGLSDRELSNLRGSRIGFAFQRFNLLPTLSILDNIRVAQDIRGIDNYSMADLIAVLELVGLEGKKDRKPSELSMGEQQRAAIARAVIHRPSILLADEPTGNLDSENSRKMIELFSRMNRELKQTILLVTHNSEIAGQAGRTVRMRDGRIV